MPRSRYGAQARRRHVVAAEHRIRPVGEAMQRLEARNGVGNRIQIGGHGIARAIVLVVSGRGGRRRVPPSCAGVGSVVGVLPHATSRAATAKGRNRQATVQGHGRRHRGGRIIHQRRARPAGADAAMAQWSSLRFTASASPTRRTQLGKTQFRVPETPEGTGKEAQEGREDEEEAARRTRSRPRTRAAPAPENGGAGLTLSVGAAAVGAPSAIGHRSPAPRIVATYLFAFNPAIWNWPELPADIRKLARRGHLDTTWSCGRHRNIEPGSRAFLVRLGVAPKGILGSGVTLTAPETRPHWREERAAAGHTYNRTTLRLEHLFELPLITFDELTVAAVPALPLGRALVGHLPARDHRRRVGGFVGVAHRRAAGRSEQGQGRQPSSGLTTPRPPRLSTCV